MPSFLYTRVIFLGSRAGLVASSTSSGVRCAKVRSSLEACFKRAGVRGAVTGLGSLFRLHTTDRELIDYRSTRTTPEETERLQRIVRRLLEHGVLISVTGLGCLSTPMGESELESFVETFAAPLWRNSAGCIIGQSVAGSHSHHHAAIRKIVQRGERLGS